MSLRRRYPFWNQHLSWFAFCGILIVTVFVVLALSLSSQQANRGILLASLLATLGWLITVFATRSNERRKATIDLVLRHQMDRSIEDHKYRILRQFPPFRPMDEGDAKTTFDNYLSWTHGEVGPSKDTPPPVGYSIVQVLNFYEFIAVGVRRGRLDEGVAYDSFAALSKKMAEKFFPFLLLCRPRQVGGKPSDTFRDLVWLTRRWHNIDLDKPDPFPPPPETPAQSVAAPSPPLTAEKASRPVPAKE